MRVNAVHLSTYARPRPHLLVQLVDGEGRRGTGEASPLPPFSREDVAACQRALAGAEDRLGEIDDRALPADAIATALGRFGGDLDAVPSARFALETALLDLLAQQRGLSVAVCLGGGAILAEVPVNALLHAAPLGTLPDRAAALAEGGFHAIKIKLRAGDDEGFARELAALHAVRERLPQPFELRLDPNAGWPEEVARARLAALAPIAPRYVEQPVAALALHRLGRCAVPWAADESLAHPDLVEPLLASGGCAAFILKPAVLGGSLRARALALRAQERGAFAVVTHFRDGPVAMAAAGELAVSLPRPRLACGLAAHDELAAFAGAAGGIDAPQLASPHTVRSSGGPGLRVALHPAERS
jgi:o-succinylbenzoate synthase